jgi:hypothetical protein
MRYGSASITATAMRSAGSFPTTFLAKGGVKLDSPFALKRRSYAFQSQDIDQQALPG